MLRVATRRSAPGTARKESKMEKYRKENNSSLTTPQYHKPEFDELIESHSKQISIPAKKVFLEPGTVLDGVYYVAKGRTRHYMVAPDGSEKVLYTLTKGWFFGETPCCLQKTTGLFSVAETDSVICLIPMQEYDALLDNNKAFRDAILESCCYKMLIMRHEIASLSFNSSRHRLMRLLCTLADTEQVIDGNWYALRMCYTQNDLCVITGCARITIAKIMSDLTNEGVIRTVNRKTQINIRKYLEFVEWTESID